ncbi:MAG: hypothetical protein Q7K39_01930 [Candidatus Magasanikbacteria bacterium]|nr:hypothetical protein [Candidatus Magasanikbacteria bacterium]
MSDRLPQSFAELGEQDVRAKMLPDIHGWTFGMLYDQLKTDGMLQADVSIIKFYNDYGTPRHQANLSKDGYKE